MAPPRLVKRLSRRQRRCAGVVLCLLLGVTTILGFAWVPLLITAYNRGNGTSRVTTSDSFITRADDGREFEASVVKEPFRVSCTLDPKDWQLGPGSERVEYPRTAAKPWWVPWPKPGKGEGSGIGLYGFPLPAMQFTQERHNEADWRSMPPQLSTKMDNHGAWTVHVGAGSTWLPVHVFWPGFAADLLIWGLIAWMLLFGWRDVRAWRRRRNGRCQLCGYDLRGSPSRVCPECGPHAELGPLAT